MAASQCLFVLFLLVCVGLVTTGKFPGMDNALEEASGNIQPESNLVPFSEETGSGDEVEEEEEEGEWQGFGPSEQDWDSGWTKDEGEKDEDSMQSSPSSVSGTASSLASSKVVDPLSSPTQAKTKGMQLLKSKDRSSKPQAGSGSKPTQVMAVPVSNSYILSKEDVERLEQQSYWASTEPDLFADMTPAIVTNQPKSRGPASSLSDGHTKNHDKSLTPSLDYQPQEIEVKWNSSLESIVRFQRCFHNYRQTDGMMGGTMNSDHTHRKEDRAPGVYLPIHLFVHGTYTNAIYFPNTSAKNLTNNYSHIPLSGEDKIMHHRNAYIRKGEDEINQSSKKVTSPVLSVTAGVLESQFLVQYLSIECHAEWHIGPLLWVEEK